jgi:hypothetical protein
LRHQHVVPLIKKGFTRAKAEFLGGGRSKEGLNVIWHTDEDNSLQVITSFADTSLPMPKIEGSVIWNSERGTPGEVLRSHQIVVAIDPQRLSP